jgi:hypothetical protein
MVPAPTHTQVEQNILFQFLPDLEGYQNGPDSDVKGKGQEHNLNSYT